MIEYKPVEGYPGYMVGSDGSVWSRLRAGGRTAKGKPRGHRNWRRLKPAKVTHGYLAVMLHDGTGKPPWQVSVHRLVLLTFLGSPPHQDSVTRHLNGARSDNRLENLAWGNQKENAADRKAHGRAIGLAGEKNGRAKLTEHQVVEIIRRCSAGERHADLAREFGVRGCTISSIMHNRAWKHLPR